MILCYFAQNIVDMTLNARQSINFKSCKLPFAVLVECPKWMYSSDCSQSCNCDRKTSTGCDVKTGACICQEGYGGADCSCHVTIASQCAEVHTFCDFDKCLCRDGVFDKPLSCSGKYNNLQSTII